MSVIPNQTPSEVDESQALARYSACPPLSELLPVKLSNGFVVNKIMTSCPRCEQTISEDATRGTLVSAFGGTALFHAVALCEHCNAIVLLNGRIKPAGRTFVIEKIEHGKWRRFSASYPWYIQILVWVREKLASHPS